MPKDYSAIDELIDLDKVEEVYKAVGCKNPKHDPTDIKYKTQSKPLPPNPTTSQLYERIASPLVKISKCDGCHFLVFETHDRYFNNVAPVPSEIPGVDSGFVDISLKKETQTERHCAAKDYISARQKFKKSFEKVFPWTV